MTKRLGRWAAALVLLSSVSACGGARRAPAEGASENAGSEPEVSSVDAVDAPELAPVPGGEPGPVGATEPEPAPVPAATSLPAGLEGWTDEDRAALEKECKPLMDAVVAVANRDRERRDRTDAALHALQSPPQVQGVKVQRCVGFLRQQLLAYRAKSIESEAIINIKRIVVGLADATQDGGRLCPSAPPVPASLDAVRAGPHQVSPDGWGAEGWRCVRFQLGGAPQRFQYELVTDPDAGTYRIIARGYPVPGHGPEELFLSGETVDGRVTPSSDVMRKVSADDR